ncbi:MAG: 2-C-methyl-D-erythritol 4-phosphate cytidylyltransferase [Bacteroidales bacterium]|nr:2-C-methyl-D-erythritol 4-phosphate cytidylyltransferase [Bacteroidales bacterium]
MNKTVAILLAAGKSERFGSDIPKPFLVLNGKSVYNYSLAILLAHSEIESVYLVVPKNLIIDIKEKLKLDSFSKPIHVIAGGKTRFESVQNALHQIQDDIKNVLIHDAARPFITTNLIDNCLDKLSEYKAVSCAIESTDTLASTDKNGLIATYPSRKTIQRIQTPQAFQSALLKAAYTKAQKDKNTDFTDDTGLVHHYKLAPVFLVRGDEQNIKITYPSDFELAQFILSK